MKLGIMVLMVFSMMLLSASGGEADILKVKAMSQGNGHFQFDVTVKHGDTGWKHYANKSQPKC